MNRSSKRLIGDGKPHERRHPLEGGGVRITTFVPFHFKKRGIKKVIVAPEARSVLRDSGRDFGTAHVNDGALHVKYELPKKVTWSQPILKEMAERIVASGDKVEDYIDIKLSVSESRYINWPPALQQQFAAARTVEEGKPTITLTLDGGAA
ncbi:hypothetical protein GCM10010975_11660 [Comamonas phosphati]|nr:hypothetical protein GCM10010975_11660 [Comamonas phosphati]